MTFRCTKWKQNPNNHRYLYDHDLMRGVCFMKIKHERPIRKHLSGFNRSALKTFLKKLGFKIGRRFYQESCCVSYKGRHYRFRWWNQDGAGFVVDISCSIEDFDRWANSTVQTIKFTDWIQ